MDIPSFTYKHNGEWQAVGSADRPVCAALSALAFGDKLGGAARGMLHSEAERELVNALLDRGLLPSHINTWVQGLLGYGIASPVQFAAGVALSPYQLDTVKRLTVAGGVGALGVGLGKTATALSAVYAYVNSNETQGKGDRLWIVCPCNAIPTWAAHRTEMEGYFNEVEIISMDSLHKMKGTAPLPVSAIIFDEVHMLGNVTARRTGAAQAVRQAFGTGLCLTGTLLHAGVEKALSILDLAIPGAARFSNKWNAGRAFNCLVQKNLGSRKVHSLARPTGANEAKFKAWLSEYTVFLTKHSKTVKAAVDIPGQEIVDVDLCQHVPDNDKWDTLARVVQELTAKNNTMPEVMETMHVASRTDAFHKLIWLRDNVITPTPQEQWVIFATYTESLDAIEAVLKGAGRSYVRIDGGITDKRRAAAISLFQSGDASVMLAQTDAASVSMNLQNAHLSCMFDVTWKAAAYDQALGRTCRRGQTQTCRHYNLIGNPFQRWMFARLAENRSFDASVAEWQEARAMLQSIQPAAHSPGMAGVSADADRGSAGHCFIPPPL
jgi:hypothetical protein